MKKRIKLLLSAVSALIACTVCLVGLTYSWYSGSGYSGYGGKYEKTLIIGGSKSPIVNYIGTVTGSDTISINYTELSNQSSFSVDDLYPGSKQYFKTKVTNTYDTMMSYTLYISQILCDSDLKDYVKICITSPSPRTVTLAGYTSTNVGNNVYSFQSIKMCDKYTVSAGNYFEIYWYVEILEGAGNNCMGKTLTIESVKIGN